MPCHAMPFRASGCGILDKGNNRYEQESVKVSSFSWWWGVLGGANSVRNNIV